MSRNCTIPPVGKKFQNTLSQRVFKINLREKVRSKAESPHLFVIEGYFFRHQKKLWVSKNVIDLKIDKNDKEESFGYHAGNKLKGPPNEKLEYFLFEMSSEDG